MIEAQSEDQELQAIGNCLVSGFINRDYELGTDGGIRIRGRLVVPKDSGLMNEILSEAHHSKFYIHPGGTKNVPRFVSKLFGGVV